jgi:ATP-dependent RNA helicase SUPV3L1/SUV3
MQIDTSSERARIVAVLGPTNTGKTHLAMERMLGHASGMIGFPLRLLARENYDRAVKQKGRAQVALITGEEKIIPAGARYFLCTVESMPLDRQVAFVGIDEIQMCADADRGHIFTDRLLNARGRDETMLMGADTIRPLLARLVPGVSFETRPRLSVLSYTGERKTARLKPRTAVVAFSASEVYSLAELVRRQRGGAAVVLGALSPRTRNAQVAMYQNDEVDYLVATDAIGMGLNMDVGHVAFAATHKFDGSKRRPLTAAELAQTAGRAGRYMNDGSFGTTGAIGALDPDVVERIENHRFDALKFLYWRNPDLDFSSMARLQQSLNLPPQTPGLLKAREADDEAALGHLAKMPEIAGMASSSYTLRLLWDVCRIPDFGKVMTDAHSSLLGEIYRHLMGPQDGGGGMDAGANETGGRLPTDWMAAQVTRLDNTDGDIETLATRIAGVRTWTYVSYQSNWLDDARHWQERTRAIEDRLSDALHRGLTQRFVDKRTAVLVSHFKDRDDLLTAVNGDGDVTVEGHYMGHLEGFRFVPDGPGDGGASGNDDVAARKVGNAAGRALRGEVETRLKRLEADADEHFGLVPDRLPDEGPEEGAWPRLITWRGHPVARLKAGTEILRPVAEPLFSDLFEPSQRDRVGRRLQTWLDVQIATLFAPLLAAQKADLAGAARGVVFQLAENLGSVRRDTVAAQIEALGGKGRKSLRPFGIRLGRHRVYLPELLKPNAVLWRGLLRGLSMEAAEIPPPPGSGRVSLDVPPGAPHGFFEAMGFVAFGALAVRCDMVERLAAKAWTLAQKGAFEAVPELLSLAGCGVDEMADILAGLGYKGRPGKDGTLRFHRTKKQTQKPKNKPKPAVAKDSPFAKLQNLKQAG